MDPRQVQVLILFKIIVLTDLKMEDMKPECVGQMNMYVNYYNKEIKDKFDNETIGIILCTGKRCNYGICFRWTI